MTKVFKQETLTTTIISIYSIIQCAFFSSTFKDFSVNVELRQQWHDHRLEYQNLIKPDEKQFKINDALVDKIDTELRSFDRKEDLYEEHDGQIKKQKLFSKRRSSNYNKDLSGLEPPLELGSKTLQQVGYDINLFLYL